MISKQSMLRPYWYYSTTNLALPYSCQFLHFVPKRNGHPGMVLVIQLLKRIGKQNKQKKLVFVVIDVLL